MHNFQVQLGLEAIRQERGIIGCLRERRSGLDGFRKPARLEGVVASGFQLVGRHLAGMARRQGPYSMHFPTESRNPQYRRQPPTTSRRALDVTTELVGKRIACDSCH